MKTEKTVKLDIPHLNGAYDSAPYLHDGRAPTLEDIFTRHNPTHQHGKAHLLTPEQLNDLVEVAISESERFYPAFQYVVWAGKTPLDALTASILETVGEA